MVRHGERLGVALCFVVDPARADRIHVAPVRLGLRVDLRVAVDLARGGEQEPGRLNLASPSMWWVPYEPTLSVCRGRRW